MEHAQERATPGGDRHLLPLPAGRATDRCGAVGEQRGVSEGEARLEERRARPWV